jgi:myosin-5
VENWIQAAGADFVADSWDELKYIRQAVTFLVIGNKPKKSLEEITTDLCPVLSIQQLYRISTMYWDDRQEKNIKCASMFVVVGYMRL